LFVAVMDAIFEILLRGCYLGSHIGGRCPKYT
jgi:hypothetical protein